MNKLINLGKTVIVIINSNYHNQYAGSISAPPIAALAASQETKDCLHQRTTSGIGKRVPQQEVFVFVRKVTHCPSAQTQ